MGTTGSPPLYLISQKRDTNSLSTPYNITGRISGMLVSGKNFSITKYVMSDDIDDIQDPRYHMRRRTFF